MKGEYYYRDYADRSRPQKSRRSLWGILLDLLVGVFSVVTILVAVLTFLAPFVNPGRAWIFSILGLIAPAVYLATVIAALYWIIRWRWGWASVLLVLVVIGLWRVPLFLKPELRRTYGEPAYGRGTIGVMTYNVRGFYDEQGRNSADSVLRMIRETGPDIVCLQEFNGRLAGDRALLEAVLPGYGCAAGASDPRAEETGSASALLICSRYPIIRSGDVVGKSGYERHGRSIWADLRIGDDTVRVFNNHLHSTAIKADDNAFITEHRFLSDTASDERIRSIVRRFRDNSILRAAQADTIARAVAASPYPQIVCGDFNDTPMSYVYRRMAGGLRDAFSVAGKGFSHTYRGFFNTLRIDYVLYADPPFEAIGYRVLTEIDYSDHHPVLVRLRKVAAG